MATTVFKKRILLLAIAWAATALCVPAGADEMLSFGPKNAILKGSIKYTVVGRYKAGFEEFSGEIRYDPERQVITGVDLTIQVKSLKSNFEQLDRLARSHRILDAKKFPTITFQSKSIKKEDDQWIVDGCLTMHGVSRDLSLPFKSKITTVPEGESVLAGGKWVLNRKEFNIIWDKVLDRGGVLVGNHFTVDWRLKIPRKGKSTAGKSP